MEEIPCIQVFLYMLDELVGKVIYAKLLYQLVLHYFSCIYFLLPKSEAQAQFNKLILNLSRKESFPIRIKYSATQSCFYPN